jgi:protein TonB
MPDNTHGSSAPEIAKDEVVLARCLMEGDADTTASARSRRRKTFGASLGIELVLLGLLVAVPLLTTVAQPQLRRDLPTDITFTHGRSDHPATQHVRPTNAKHEHASWSSIQMFPGSPRHVSFQGKEGEAEVAQDTFGDLGVPGGIEVAEINRPPFELPHVDPPKPTEKHPLKVSEGVLQAQLLTRIEPRYPPLSVQLKMEGTVVLHAIIGRDGRISTLQVVSGSPFFVQAALDAVRQWRYRPTMLNGEPVEVDTSITVIFHLRSQ